ncbi:MAG: hypothetical protein PHD29_08830 [bacterium]|nr:hypothetical protein [bacterium]
MGINRNKQQAWTAIAILCSVVLIPYYWIYAKVDVYVDGKVISARGIDLELQMCCTIIRSVLDRWILSSRISGSG